MKNYPSLCNVFLFGAYLISLTYSCNSKSPDLILTTANVSGVSQTSAVSGGNISSRKINSVTARGVCWGTEADPSLADNKTENGTETGSFICTLTGLQPGTDYYIRAYAISGSDTVYGSNVSFSTLDYETVSDIEGNEYKVIAIGRQTWMAENLRTTKLNDGTPVPLVKDESKWTTLATPAYCFYKNDEEAFKPVYGALYNWYAVNTGKLCPSGWHVPGDPEWTLLTDFLGGENIAGGKLKEIGSTYWVEPNAGATNESGFTAYPGGFRYSDGKFFDFGFSSYWWASGEFSSARAYFRFLYYSDANIYRFDNVKKNGFSVRCLKD